MKREEKKPGLLSRLKRSGKNKAEKEEQEVKKEKSTRSFRGWVRERRAKGKEKERLEQAKESYTLKLITLITTIISMSLGFSFIPLFPQPIPILLAVLMGFIAFRSPRIGITVGSTLIGLSLIFHLSELSFISYLGETYNRIVFTAAWLILFIATPIIYHRHRTAIAINMGIIAAMVLFFEPIYFLAVPIILATAVFLKFSAISSVLYYFLISVPLMIVQYFRYTILSIPQEEWWIVPGSSPPVFVPLNNIFSSLETSMTQFRLFDTAGFVYTVYQELFENWPHVIGKTLKAAFVQYLDSFPGLFLFAVIVVGIVMALIFFAKLIIQETSIPYAEQLFWPGTAIVATVLFFVMLNLLAKPLAFEANIDGATIMLATLATAAFTVPLSLIKYQPKSTATSQMIIAKANELKGELMEFKGQLENVKTNIPVDVASPEGKMLIIQDKLDDILNKSISSFFAEADLPKIYDDLNNKQSKDIKDLPIELNTILAEYQVFVNGEYSDWSGKLKEAGFKVNQDFKLNFQREMSLEERIQTIKSTLEASKIMAFNTIETVEPIYNIIRSLYDPNLPERCQVVNYAIEKLHKQMPFHAISGLYGGIVNWKRQYGEEVALSIEQLNKSLIPIIDLGKEPEKLSLLLGDKVPLIIADAKKAQIIKQATDKTPVNVVNLITLRELLDYFIDIAKHVLSILHEEVKKEEQAIDNLSPAQDTYWAKNATLNERLTVALEELYDPKAKINKVMMNLPRYLAYIDEAIQTLTAYSDRKEFLLNYPMAEKAIEEQLKTKKKISAKDLPFQSKYALEYLRLFYMQRFSDFQFDNQNQLLIKKA